MNIERRIPMSQTSKKKKPFKLGRVTIPIICVLLVILIAGNIGCMYYSRILDVYIGTGEATITTKEGAESWDTEYYKPDYATAEDADRYAKDVTRRIAEAGKILNIRLIEHLIVGILPEGKPDYYSFSENGLL